MSKFSILSSMVCIAFCFACGNPNPKQETTTAPSVAKEMPLVGNDVDEHGCKGSAGFIWSAVKAECIKISDTGIRLDAQAKELDQTTAAFVVFKSDTDDARAEVFLPATPSFVLTKVKDDGAGTWKNDAYTLTQWKGMYTLENNKKQILYQGGL